MHVNAVSLNAKPQLMSSVLVAPAGLMSNEAADKS